VANFLPRSIILTMAVSFAISFAVMYWQRKPEEHPLPQVDAAPSIAVGAPATMPAAMPAEPSIAALVAPAPRAAARVDAAARPAPPEEATPSEEAGVSEALPVAFHIRNRRDLHVIDGDIRNITSKPMSITLRSVNPSTQATSEIHFELAPGEKKTYSTENGLAMQTDDQLIVQSPPYQDRVVRVP
jgi:hypothetical protein